MCENAIPQATSSPFATAGRSLFSRLTSPLRSRTRNLADFHIRPLEPHRQYSPGDLVKGIVVLTVVKPIRITHLTVALHGFVRVYRTPNAVADTTGTNEPALAPGTSIRKSQYFGNGHASLFQDEVILCGEGRLEIGVYEFEFNLEFPSTGLPSSIDFERGTISYMIRSTITRPTSIAATSSCDRKVSLIETVDIGTMQAPKPRVISLEPISKRQKKPTKPKTKSDPENPDEEQTDTTAPTSLKSPVIGEPASPSPPSAAEHPESPRSPINSDGHSEASGESVVSSSTGMSFRLAPAPSSRSARDSQGDRSSDSVASKTITATIELLKAGCLRGDSIPLRISIQHTKRIKSMHGIIITLYRQGRIDSAPPLSMFTDIKGKAAEKLKHEEYYPKSKTGLGGLSLSSAGSSSVFRKDLSQTFAPIIIDPGTLSTVVNTSIRIPDDVFPTITGVPGQMINFRYHIEVVIDLGGKLAGTSRHLPKLGMMNAPANFSNNNQMLGREDGSPAMLAAWGGSIVDTDHIRREKSVVACVFEVVVGTIDSARVRARQNTNPRSQTEEPIVGTPQSQTFSHEYPEEEVSPRDYVDDGHQAPNLYGSSSNYLGDQSLPGGGYDYAYSEGQRATTTPYDIHPPYEPNPPYERPYIPPPDISREGGISEKEQIRRAEQRLLPSQPPQEDGPSSSGATAPSAPPDPIADPSTSWASEVTHTSRAIAPSFPATIEESVAAPSAPALEDLAGPASNNPSDDKQELERRRLMAEASSPSDFPEDHENAGEGSSSAQYEATAPVLTEEDYGSSTGHSLPGGSARNQGYGESLPKYER